ncbi:hypothetical protein N7456_012113 [Penicillium angulare]|uniref:Major facilitator superfamily (MFS) profile domain-containing protein n=1 Tax=Penicillium angulare TaxID=116970 RepID=A0A9W9EUX4_9EURO|nr:hypothetical protein N7456_012113 [Penicillium angulare]
MDALDDSEARPLLAGNASMHSTTASKNRRNRKKFLILVVSAIFILAADFGTNLSVAPQTAIFEQIICQKYSELGGALNTTDITFDTMNPCKSETVQGELALVLGYKEGLDVLPTMFLSIPYGVLSDHWGRKSVICLGITGLILSELWTRLVCLWSSVLPLRLVWLSSIWKIIGGGDQVLIATACVTVADIFPEEEMSTALFTLMSWALVSDIVASPASAYLMTYDPWIPYILGFIIISIGCVAILFLPETLEYAQAKKADAQRRRSDTSIQLNEPSIKLSTSQLLARHIHEFKEATQFMWKDSNTLWMILIAFVAMISKQSTNILLQYTSKRFNWSIAKASLLIALRGSFGLFTFSVMMPFLTWMVGKYFNLHGKHRDHLFSQLTGILCIIGFLVIGLAPTPEILIGGLVIASMGAAFPINTRSLATLLVMPDHVGTLYSALAISQSMGAFVAGPLFAYLFRIGMHFGGVWLGLPFLQASFFFVIATAAVWRIKVNRELPGMSEISTGERRPLVS